MNIDQLTKLLGAIISLLQAIIWPLLIFFVLLYLGEPIKQFLSNIGKLTIKTPGGGEVSVEAQIKTAVALSMAVAGENKNKPEGSADNSSEEIVRLVTQASTPQASKRISEASVLWVDDHPENQRYERDALKVLGIRFTTSLSTEEALIKLRRQKYDVIISDMGRPPDARAGYTLLGSLPELNKSTPFFIYSATGSKPEHRAEASQRGAAGSTDRIQELIEMMLDALKKQ